MCCPHVMANATNRVPTSANFASNLAFGAVFQEVWRSMSSWKQQKKNSITYCIHQDVCTEMALHTLWIHQDYTTCPSPAGSRTSGGCPAAASASPAPPAATPHPAPARRSASWPGASWPPPPKKKGDGKWEVWCFFVIFIFLASTLPGTLPVCSLNQQFKNLWVFDN